jgi:ubiquinol-cytochrome c reductase cytochrome c subunit
MRRPRRSSHRARVVMTVLAVVCATGAVYGFAVGSSSAQKGTSVNPGPAPPPATGAQAAQVERGRKLFLDGCSSCHGNDARGKQNIAPTLVGAGEAAADFYLSTGRMPLADPTDQPERTQPAYPRADIDALVAYVGSFGGPGIPRVDPGSGDLAKGMEAFTEHCAGCHQVAGRGGIVTGAAVPALDDATPTQVGEAVRIGPYVMPKFSAQQIDPATLNAIARYVQSIQDPDNRGGWGIGNLGPIPEGMVTWFLAMGVLLFAARLIGERAR